MAYAKKLREKLAPIAASIQSIIDAAKAADNRGLTAEERTKFDALVADHSKIEADIAVAEKADSVMNSINKVDQVGRIDPLQAEEFQDTFRKTKKNRTPHDEAFSKFLRYGMSALDDDESKLMRFISNGNGKAMGIKNAQTETTTGGGYLIPQGFSGQLEEAKKWFGGIAGVVDKFTTETGNPFPWPTVNDTSNKGRIIGQNTQVTETDFAFGQVTFNAYIGSSDLILIPLALLQDAYFDMDALTARLLGTRLGRLYNNKCTVGSGSSEPTGVVNAAVTAGSLVNMSSTSAITYADLVSVESTVDPSYRFNPSTFWMFPDSVLTLLKNIVDGNNRPLWQPGLTASFREGAAVDLVAAKPTILGHPYIINQDMASISASASCILFGDMSTFKVREVSGGTTVLRLAERYADYLQVGYIAFQRFDSNLIDAGTHPIAVGQGHH